MDIMYNKNINKTFENKSNKLLLFKNSINDEQV